MDPIPDFSRRRSFPGTVGNPFDHVLRRLEAIERIPLPAFAAGLLFLAALPTFRYWQAGGWWVTAALWAFFLADWALMAVLPRYGVSYGPARVPTLCLAVARAAFALLPLPLAFTAQASGTLLVIYGFWVEPRRIRVTRQSLQSDKLRPGLPPLRVLHMGDLHVERITGREHQLNALVQELAPDLILFSGDILNLSYLDDPVAQAHARQVISAWSAPGGIYAVTGSPAVDYPETFGKILDGLNVIWLKADCAEVEIGGQRINILGLECTHKPFIDAPRLDALAANARGAFTILLYHSPDLAPNAARTGVIDLQLSGHTHGGQVRLPLVGALFAGSLYGKRFEAGRYRLGAMTLYVSRGIGLEGKAAPRVRFLCPPEIILWEISGAPAQTGIQ